MDFQNQVISSYGSLRPSTQDVAILPLAEKLFRVSKSSKFSTPVAASFAAIGQSVIYPSPARLPHPPPSPSEVGSKVDNDVAKLMAF